MIKLKALSVENSMLFILERNNYMSWLAVLLTVIFVVVKLLGIIAWSWWLVFTPAIIYGVIALIIIVITFIAAFKD